MPGAEPPDVNESGLPVQGVKSIFRVHHQDSFRVRLFINWFHSVNGCLNSTRLSCAHLHRTCRSPNISKDEQNRFLDDSPSTLTNANGPTPGFLSTGIKRQATNAVSSLGSISSVQMRWAKEAQASHRSSEWDLKLEHRRRHPSALRFCLFESTVRPLYILGFVPAKIEPKSRANPVGLRLVCLPLTLIDDDFLRTGAFARGLFFRFFHSVPRLCGWPFRKNLLWKCPDKRSGILSPPSAHRSSRSTINVRSFAFTLNFGHGGLLAIDRRFRQGWENVLESTE